MRFNRNDKAVSELLGAILLVALLMTGLSIISVMILSVPPPTSTQKAVLGVKCAWCPNIDNPDQSKFDILIDHEGGENLSLKHMRYTLISEGNIPQIFTPQYVYAPTDPTHYYEPPQTCDDEKGLDSRLEWSVVDTFSAGRSMKYSYSPPGGIPKNITFILIEEPSSIGYVPIAKLRISYIQNLNTYGSILGTGGQVVSSGAYFVTPSYDKSTLLFSEDGCEVDFLYSNPGDDAEYGWGSRGQPWNYIESFNYPPPISITPYPPQSTFPHEEDLHKVMTVKFTGYIEYRLGYRSSAITCNERIINYLKN